jgi:hypothetical protein
MGSTHGLIPWIKPWIKPMDLIHVLNPWIQAIRFAHGLNPCNKQVHVIHAFNPCSSAVDSIHGFNPRIQSMDVIHGLKAAEGAMSPKAQDRRRRNPNVLLFQIDCGLPSEMCVQSFPNNTAPRLWNNAGGPATLEQRRRWEGNAHGPVLINDMCDSYRKSYSTNS